GSRETGRSAQGAGPGAGVGRRRARGEGITRTSPGAHWSPAPRMADANTRTLSRSTVKPAIACSMSSAVSPASPSSSSTSWPGLTRPTTPDRWCVVGRVKPGHDGRRASAHCQALLGSGALIDDDTFLHDGIGERAGGTRTFRENTLAAWYDVDRTMIAPAGLVPPSPRQ